MPPPSYNAAVTTFIAALLASLLCTLLIVRVARTHARRSVDRDFDKPQKFHAKAVPRIGGLGVVLGLCAALPWLWWSAGAPAVGLAASLLACALPVFLVGLAHDLSDAWTPRARLGAAALSALLACLLLDATIVRTDIPGLDAVVSIGLGAIAVTLFSVTGIAHAVNIIDGFNGLASMCAVLMLVAVCYVGFQVEDRVIALMALAGIGAVLGFFVWNFPAGLVFLGDGGAYFLGFYVAELCILLLARNPEVSPMFALLVCIYPIFETIFSVYRRWILRARPASMPDGIHLHSLIYRRVLRWAAGGNSVRARIRRNSMTSPYLWILCMASIIPAMLFWDSSAVLAAMLGLFVVSYVLLYRRIVRFRSPRWLRLGQLQARPPRTGDNPRQ
jgi:UDP-N-acetylmuramyl pentapeptide phosphotransferase/UDP-N-acetylglucosamine-1-phosphate transferase